MTGLTDMARADFKVMKVGRHDWEEREEGEEGERGVFYVPHCTNIFAHVCIHRT